MKSFSSGMSLCFLLLIAFGILLGTPNSAWSDDQNGQTNLTDRSNLYLQIEGDHPMKAGSAGQMGTVFSWITTVDANRHVLQILGVVTPEGVLPEQLRPRSGDVFLGVYREFPDTSADASMSTKNYEPIGSFQPPRQQTQVAVFHKKIPLAGEIDKDGNNSLEIRVILKPDKRGLNQKCEDVPMCGVATELISVPIPPNNSSTESTSSFKDKFDI